MAKRRSTPFLIAMLVGLLIAPLGAGTAAATGPALSLPTSMAAIGDSITQAASSGGTLGADYPANSWATGTNSSVNSQFLRLRALGAPISSTTNNLSVSGAKMADLVGQMQNVIVLKPDYLTVLIGGNDLCTDTVGQMTSVTNLHSEFQSAMSSLSTASPGTHVLVASIPDVYQLWSLFHSSFWARFIWSAGGVCQSLLANPTSTQSADVQRRAAVRQRNIDFNAELKSTCESVVNCLYDNDAVFNVQFAKSDVAGDYFHPSIAGQAKLASVTWSAGYTWSSTPPANIAPIASFTSACTNLTCAFTDTSSDADGSVTGWSWTFGSGGSSSSQNPSFTFPADGTYPVTLTVTDNLGATSALFVAQVTVSSGVVTISLSAVVGSPAGKNKVYVNLTWSVSPSAPGNRTVYRDGSAITTTANDSYTDTVSSRRTGYLYQVCLTGTSTCSNTISAP